LEEKGNCRADCRVENIEARTVCIGNTTTMQKQDMMHSDFESQGSFAKGLWIAMLLGRLESEQSKSIFGP
jgi:hypothetical protein